MGPSPPAASRAPRSAVGACEGLRRSLLFLSAPSLAPSPPWECTQRPVGHLVPARPSERGSGVSQRDFAGDGSGSFRPTLRAHLGRAKVAARGPRFARGRGGSGAGILPLGKAVPGLRADPGGGGGAGLRARALPSRPGTGGARGPGPGLGGAPRPGLRSRSARDNHRKVSTDTGPRGRVVPRTPNKSSCECVQGALEIRSGFRMRFGHPAALQHCAAWACASWQTSVGAGTEAWSGGPLGEGTLKLLFDTRPSVLGLQGQEICPLLTSGRVPVPKVLSTAEEVPRKLLPPQAVDTQAAPRGRTRGSRLAVRNSQGQSRRHVLPPALAGGGAGGFPEARNFPSSSPGRGRCFPRCPHGPRPCPPASQPQASRPSAQFCSLSIMQKINQSGRAAALSTAACN